MYDTSSVNTRHLKSSPNFHIIFSSEIPGPEGQPTLPWRKNFEVDQSSRGPLAQQPGYLLEIPRFQHWQGTKIHSKMMYVAMSLNEDQSKELQFFLVDSFPEVFF